MPQTVQLIESGLGSEYSTGTGFISYLKDSLFSAGLKDARIEDLDQIHELVVTGIKECFTKLLGGYYSVFNTVSDFLNCLIYDLIYQNCPM